jgi:cytochrome c oxidase subunit 2
VGDTRGLYDDVARLYGPIALVVAALVFSLVIGFAIRYRAGRRDARAVSRRSSAPLVEGVYVLALAAVAVVLVATTFRAEGKEGRLASRPALQVRVTAAKWRWRFDYPGGVSQVGGARRVPTLVVPAGRTVRFSLSSLDVVHAFWIPDLRFKRDATPGETGVFDLRFPPGQTTSVGECSEFCGLGHASMRFLVKAVAPADFRAWIARRHGAAG